MLHKLLLFLCSSGIVYFAIEQVLVFLWNWAFIDVEKEKIKNVHSN